MGHVGGQNRTVYCMTKHGIEGLTKAMAIDLAPLGIWVNSIGPTFIDTPLTKPFFQNVAFRDDVLRRIKLGPARHGGGPDGRARLPGERRRRAGDGNGSDVDGGWTAE
jgi:NAD(P)-dependent dehydrogenase (short-subunit alcohol dehydrogenase family)